MNDYSDYDNFSWLYNKEWSSVVGRMLPGLQYLAGDNLVEGAEILDVCCGTGQLAEILTGLGYKVTGIDISAAQLRYARQNAPAARFIKKDVRSFKLNRKYDVAFSTFDSLNHIMKLDELQHVFKNVYNCLKPGGIFVFDMTTKRLFEQSKHDQNIFEGKDYFYTQRVEYNAGKRTNTVTITLFRRIGKNWKRFDSELAQTFYPAGSITGALKKAGFEDIHAFGAEPQRGFYPPDKKTLRIYYSARKD